MKIILFLKIIFIAVFFIILLVVFYKNNLKLGMFQKRKVPNVLLFLKFKNAYLQRKTLILKLQKKP